MKLFRDITKSEFLENFWEKRPYIFRNVISDPEKLIDKDDLLEMSSDEYYESRLIMQEKASDKWILKHGPFEKIDQEIKNKKWTIINHNLELYLENVLDLKNSFNFISNWLFDDVMSTYSNKNSSVGAHIDNYNVFILQTNGTRNWLLETNPNHDYIEGIEVRILKKFNPDLDYTLNPGDMIYIPPHVAHHGITTDESISLSFGFKSIEKKKIVDEYALSLLDHYKSDDFFKTDLCIDQADSKEVSNDFLDLMYAEIKKEIMDENKFKSFLIKMLSGAKKDPEENELDEDEFNEMFMDRDLFKDEYIRFSYGVINSEKHVFINKIPYPCNDEDLNFIKEIIDLAPNDSITNKKFGKINGLLYKMYCHGHLFFEQ